MTLSDTEGEELTLTLPASGERLDQALAALLPDFSRAQVQRLIKEGLVAATGTPLKASLRLQEPLEVTVTLPPVQMTDLVPENIPLDIYYEDDDLIVVNKPAGMVVHPGAGHETGTLVHAILGHCPDIAGIGGERRPGIVHRLDMDTSGLIIVAKNDRALRDLQAQFKDRTITKRYVALVEGQVQPAEAVIDAPLGRDPRQRKKMAVIRGGSAQARPAQTTYQTLTGYDDYTLVECFPKTGRTHQIRVHMAFIGHPLVGDAVYGRRKQPLLRRRHFLHAAGLAFNRPGSDERLQFEAPLPPELQAVLDSLAI